MRRVAVYRDGNQMAAQIGPDWVEGIAGFGDTVADALRDLAKSFAKHRYELRGNSVGIEVAGRFIEVHAHPGQSPSDLLIRLAAMMEEGGYRESDFPEPNWEWLANEERVFLPGVQYRRLSQAGDSAPQPYTGRTPSGTDPQITK